MTSSAPLFQRNYVDGKPFVRVKISIVNPRTNRFTTFEEECWLDTGFSGGIYVPEYRRSEAAMVNVKPRPTTLELAGGQRAPGYVCMAYIQQIQNFTLPAPGISTELIMQGRSSYGLLGLEILGRWIANFNGPSRRVTVY